MTNTLFFKNELNIVFYKIELSFAKMNNLSISYGIITIFQASHFEKHFLWADEAKNQHCDLTPLFLFSRTETEISFGKNKLLKPIMVFILISRQNGK